MPSNAIRMRRTSAIKKDGCISGLPGKKATGRPGNPARPVIGSFGVLGAFSTQYPLPPPVMGPYPLGPVPSNLGMVFTSRDIGCCLGFDVIPEQVACHEVRDVGYTA